MNVYVGRLSAQLTEAGFRRQQAATKGEMRITMEHLGPSVRERLRDRLEHAARLRCTEHDRGVIAVTLHGRENGWFDSMWTTCCEGLEQQAAAIVKERC